MQPLAPSFLPSLWYSSTAIMAEFASSISITAAQLAAAPKLEPAFEHLLRNSSVHESIIGTLRVNAITDRDTFVNMFDSEAALNDGASDLGIRLFYGGAYRTSASSHASLRPGRSRKKCRRLSARQTQLLVPTVFQSRSSPVIGCRSLWNSRTSSESIYQTTNFPLSQCSRILRSALQTALSRQNRYRTW